MKWVLVGLLLAAGQCHALTVFLYARADRSVVDCLAHVAAVYGPVWTDFEIRPGMAWRRAVSLAIRRADVIFLIWSPAAAQSQEVASEWKQALAAGKRLVPVTLGNDGTVLPGELAALQWLDAGFCRKPHSNLSSSL